MVHLLVRVPSHSNSCQLKENTTLPSKKDAPSKLSLVPASSERLAYLTLGNPFLMFRPKFAKKSDNHFPRAFRKPENDENVTAPNNQSKPSRYFQRIGNSNNSLPKKPNPPIDSYFPKRTAEMQYPPPPLKQNRPQFQSHTTERPVAFSNSLQDDRPNQMTSRRFLTEAKTTTYQNPTERSTARNYTVFRPLERRHTPVTPNEDIRSNESLIVRPIPKSLPQSRITSPVSARPRPRPSPSPPPRPNSRLERLQRIIDSCRPSIDLGRRKGRRGVWDQTDNNEDILIPPRSPLPTFSNTFAGNSLSTPPNTVSNLMGNFNMSNEPLSRLFERME